VEEKEQIKEEDNESDEEAKSPAKLTASQSQQILPAASTELTPAPPKPLIKIDKTKIKLAKLPTILFSHETPPSATEEKTEMVKPKIKVLKTSNIQGLKIKQIP